MTNTVVPTRVENRIPQPPSWVNGRFLWLLIFAIALGLSLWQSGIFNDDVVNEGGWTILQRFLSAALRPETAVSFLQLTLNATLVTLAYAVSSVFLSVLIGLLLGVFVSELWWEAVWPRRWGSYRLIWSFLRMVLALPRGIHELLWGLIFINLFGLDPLTAILAITVPYSAIVGKIFSEMIDEVEKRPYWALRNSGAPPLKSILYGVLPQVFPDFLSYAFYRFECAIRAAAVLGVIGAGGLGYQILLSLQTLRYEELWTLFYALVLLSGVADYWSATLRRRLGRVECNCAAGEWQGKQAETSAMVPVFDPVLRVSFWVWLLLVPLSFVYIRADFSLLWAEKTAVLFNDLAQQSWPPRLSVDIGQNLLQLSGQTLAMAFLSTMIASVGGILLAFPAARDFSATQHQPWRRLLKTAVIFLTRGILLFMRAIPAPIWALVFLFVLFPGILPGALALGIYNLGVLGRLMAEVVENMEKRPFNALKNQGASEPQAFLYATVPTTLPRHLAYSLYRWEIAIRATVIVGLVGAGGLGRLLTQQLSTFDFRSVIMTLFTFVLLTFAADLVSATVRRTFR